MRLEFSGPPSHKTLALSTQAPERRARYLKTHRTASSAALAEPAAEPWLNPPAETVRLDGLDIYGLQLQHFADAAGAECSPLLLLFGGVGPAAVGFHPVATSQCGSPT
jgi:hypothetical protein